ncbi:ABC transporter permease [Castellaniella sp.]|uniref:ABC transporter permease n=1 Tax=Castellaniella sp. TaxID=1955812 RepID=UPI003561DC37
MKTRWLERSAPYLIIVAFFLVWEIVCVVFSIKEFILPRPTVILASVFKYHDALAFHSLHTLFTTAVGFVAAVVGGIFLGVLVGSSRLLYVGLYPMLIGFNSVPKVAIVPILVIWVGIGTVPAIITAFITSFFPVTVNVATGLATLEPELEDVLRTLGATKMEILRKVGIPRTLPYLFASLKVVITLAFVGSVISETIASNEGIGYLILTASARFDVPLVFAALLLVSVMGIGMYAIFAAIETRTTGWATQRVNGTT